MILSITLFFSGELIETLPKSYISTLRSPKSPEEILNMKSLMENWSLYLLSLSLPLLIKFL